METVKHPCRNCVYFTACGENTRTMPCNGRKTKAEQKKERKDKMENISSSFQFAFF